MNKIKPNLSLKKVSIIGIGLIGSSIALASKSKIKNIFVSLFDIDPIIRNQARDLNLGDEVTEEIGECVKGTDLVILAIPVGSMKNAIKTLIPHLNKDVIITDTGSTKVSVTKDLSNLLPKNCYYIGGHPLAGTEFSGPKSGFPSLFEDRYWLIIPDINPENKIKTLEKFCQCLGSMTERVNVSYHDRIVALTSHLPHLIAFTIVKTVSNLDDDIKRDVIKFSASGFRDFTRIASSDPVMWRDIFLNNQDSILEILDRFNQNLEIFKTCIKLKKGQELLEIFNETREVRKLIVEARQDIPEDNKAKIYFKYSRNNSFPDGQ